MKKWILLGVLVLIFFFIAGCIGSSATKLHSETFVVGAGTAYFLGDASGSGVVTRHYVLTSSAPINVYIVPNRANYELMRLGAQFDQYSSCRGIQVLSYERECDLNIEGGIAISNSGTIDAIITLEIYG